MNRLANSEEAELVAENLVYEINDKLILNDLSLRVKTGEILFIEGGNGCGKTTLLRILCGLIQADEGSVSWNGESIQEGRIDYYQQLTYIGHATGVKPELTTLENMQFFSSISGLPCVDDMRTAIDWVGLGAYENSPGRHLSYGQQRRIALSRLMIESSQLWILDEPFSGLDQDMIEKLQQRFLQHTNDDGLIILTSHQAINLDKMNSTRIQLGR
jgi:heme exporter protein A